MHPTAKLLVVGLLAAAGSGCTSSRWNLAKSDSPKPPANNEEVRVKYGFPWSNGSKKQPEKNEALTADLQTKLAEARAKSAANVDVPDHLRKAALAESSGDLAGAKQLYLKVLDADARNAEAHHRLGVIADQQRDTRAADQHYAQALAMTRKDSDLLHDVGYSHLLRGNLDESERYLKEALEVNSFNQRASEHLGQVYARQGKYDAALAQFRQCATEREAQQMLAQAFPNGRPGSGGTPATPVAEQRTAQPLPDFSQGGQTLDQIQQLMAQERAAAQRAREQRIEAESRPPWDDFNAQRAPANAASAGNHLPQPQYAGAAQPANPNRATLPQIANTLLPSVTPGPASAPLPTTTPATSQPGANSAGQPWPAGSSVPQTNLAGNSTAPTTTWGGGPNANPAPANTANAPATQNAPTFWQGALANNAPSTATNAPSNTATTYDTARVPTPSNPLWSPGAAPATSNAAMPSSQGSPWTNPNYQSTGYERQIPPGMPGASTGASTNADAARWAAQMAMGAGPGAMFPTVTQVSHTGGPGNVNFAYGELPSGAPFNQVDPAVWTQDRAAPPANAQPAGWNGNIAPTSPWNNWQSPAPPSTNWMTPGDNAAPPANMQPPPNYPSGAAATAPSGSYNAAPPPWPNAPAATSRPTQTADALGAFEAELRNAVNSAPANNATFPAPNSTSAPTTIQNWPYQPTR